MKRDYVMKPADVGGPDEGVILGLQGDAERRCIGFSLPGEPMPSTGNVRRLFRYTGTNHLLSIGPSGAGKTTGPVIMNALDHRGPLVVVDPKGDVYRLTADHRRRQGNEVVLLDLDRVNPESGSFNPMDAYRLAPSELSVVARAIASTFVPRQTKEEAFWLNWSTTVYTGAIAFVLSCCPPEEQNFGRLFDLFNNDDVVYGMASILDTHGKKLDRCTHSAFAGFLQLSEKETRPSVLGSVQQHVMLWESDLIRRITNRTSFDLAGLVEGKPISLYITASPSAIPAYAPLLRLWLSGLLTAMMGRRSAQAHRTLFLCDEMSAIGPMEAFVTASCYMRSFGVQLFTFWQNAAQLEAYGASAKTLVDNAGVLQFLGARNFRMASEFADLVGGISAEEIMQMGLDEQLVLVDGGSPQRLKRARYFDLPEFDRMVHDQSALLRPPGQAHGPSLPESGRS